MRIPLVFGTDFIFKLALGVSGVFSFAAIGMFSRTWIRLHVFWRLDTIAFFPALGASCMFLRTWS